LAPTISIGGHLAFFLALGISFAGHPSFILVGMWCFGDLMVFWWAPRFSFGGHVALILVGTWHFGMQLAFLLWPPGIFVGTQRFFRCACGISLATQRLHGHPVFLFVGMWHFCGPRHLGGHRPFIFLRTWLFGVHLASLCTPSISFGEHVVF